MFKAHRGTHFTTWFHWNSQEFEMGTKGWKRGLHWWQELREKGEREREKRILTREGRGEALGRRR
jgi:hypothetical protein